MFGYWKIFVCLQTNKIPNTEIMATIVRVWDSASNILNIREPVQNVLTFDLDNQFTVSRDVLVVIHLLSEDESSDMHFDDTNLFEFYNRCKYQGNKLFVLVEVRGEKAKRRWENLEMRVNELAIKTPLFLDLYQNKQISCTNRQNFSSEIALYFGVTNRFYSPESSKVCVPQRIWGFLASFFFQLARVPTKWAFSLCNSIARFININIQGRLY